MNLWAWAHKRGIVARRTHAVHKAIGREVRLLTGSYSERDIRTAHFTAIVCIFATERMETARLPIWERDTRDVVRR